MKSGRRGSVEMKTYWDSSALLNALVSKKVFDRLSSGENMTRSHAYLEIFSHLSGRGLPMKDGTRQKTSAEDSAKMIRGLAAKLTPRDLSCEEVLNAIDMAKERGVQGARIHDLIHARAAALSGCEVILTRDADFGSLGEKIRAEWP